MRLSVHRLALTLFVTVLAVWIVVMAMVMRHAALPPGASGAMLVVFEPGTSDDQIFASLTRAEARVVRPSVLSFVWVVAGDEPGLAGRLQREGALGSYRELPISPVIAGCFAFADAKVASLTPETMPSDPCDFSCPRPPGVWQHSQTLLLSPCCTLLIKDQPLDLNISSLAALLSLNSRGETT